jgi:hypothetical protein
MRRKIRAQLTTNRVMVLVIAVLFALAWAVPSIGASAGKVARVALARSNQAVHDSNVAVATSNTAKTTANSANATAGAANNTANTANTTANSAKATANQALSLANAAAQVQQSFTRTLDPNNITSGSCSSTTFSQFGVLSTSNVIMTPPSTQQDGIVTQAIPLSGQVKVEFCNVSNSAIDPASLTYRFLIIS